MPHDAAVVSEPLAQHQAVDGGLLERSANLEVGHSWGMARVEIVCNVAKNPGVWALELLQRELGHGPSGHVMKQPGQDQAGHHL